MTDTSIVEALPLTIQFSLAYLDGVMAEEHPEVRKNWETIRSHFISLAAANAAPLQAAQPEERDNCQFCLGIKGGVKGNENRIDDVVVCDYCSFLLSKMKDAPPPSNGVFSIAERAQTTAPEGHKLVPIEPTEEMLRAADESDREYSARNFGTGLFVCQGGYDHWKAMIAAAPGQADGGI